MKELKNILYGEDEPDIRAIAQIALEDIGGFSVKYCSNGKEILEAAKVFVPDLILLDVMMPEMDGTTTLERLREMPGMESIPAIFMTAKIQSNEVENYKSMGVVDVIEKPFDPMTLGDRLKMIWERIHEELNTR